MQNSLTRILIPANFTVRSLCAVIDIVESHSSDRVSVLLVCGKKTGGSLAEKLAFSKEASIQNMQSSDFLKAREVIKSRFENKLDDIQCDIVSSWETVFLKNYLKAMNVEEVVVAEGLFVPDSRGELFDIAKSLKKLESTGVKIVSFSNDGGDFEAEDTFSSLFFRKKDYGTFG